MATTEPPATPEAKADGSKKAAERQSAAHLSAARYWFWGVALAVILVVLIILLMSTGESVVCQKKGEAVLCVALALGIGFGFLGGTAKIEGRGDWWGIGFPVTAAFSGGIAGVLLGIWAVDFVVGKQCKLPERIACNEYATDGTCKRCLADVSFNRVKRGGTLGQPLYCNSMKTNTAVEISFHAYTTVMNTSRLKERLSSLA